MHRTGSILVVLWIIAFFACPGAYADGSWTTWTTDDGLPGNRILALTCSPDGTVWTGTDNGAARFDGAKWTTVSIADGLADNKVRSIAVGTDGAVWFGTDGGGISRLQGETWTTFKPADDFTARYFATLAVAPDGAVYAGGMGGMFRYNGAEWTCVIADEIERIILAPDGTGWAGSKENLYRLAGSTAELISDADFWKNPVIPVASDTRGNAWFARLLEITWSSGIQFGVNQWIGDGLSVYDNGEWLNQTATAGMAPGTNVSSAATDSRGAIWFATSSGLVHFDGASWKTFTVAEGLPENMVTAVTATPSGAVWIGTNTAGVARLTDIHAGIENDHDLPRTFGSLRVSPNPFNPSTALSFTLPQPGRVSLTVYDITGRKVRTLLSGPMSAGVHSVVWDGRDERGADVASGVYLSRLETGAHTASTKMLLVE